jgi:predicted DsbA family dithiol-disulfide isomerase
MDLEIDIYSDIVCPWCFIGTRRLESVLDSLEDERKIVVRHHPFLLHPDAPPEGLDLRQMLADRYGTDPESMLRRVEAAARESGIPLDLSKQRRTYSTIAAHTLSRHAEARGTQRGLHEALFTAYFLDARNIADPAVLSDVAARHGFAADEAERLAEDDAEIARTQADVEATAARGIRGVPVFIFNGRRVLAGAQPVDVFRDAIAKAAQSETT